MYRRRTGNRLSPTGEPLGSSSRDPNTTRAKQQLETNPNQRVTSTPSCAMIKARLPLRTKRKREAIQRDTRGLQIPANSRQRRACAKRSTSLQRDTGPDDRQQLRLGKTRSRSPRRSNQKQITAASGPQMLALPAPSAPARGQKGGKPNRRAGARNTASKGSGKGQASKDFDYLMKLPLEFRTNFHEKFHKNEICYGFQKKKACKRTDGTCKFSHICVGCGGSKPYNDCKCLTAKLP